MDDSAALRWKGSQDYWEKLAETYSGMFRKNPRSYIYVPLADALYHAGMASKAADTLEMGLALLPNSGAGMTLLARLRSEAGDAAGAKSLLLEVVSRWPDNTAAVTMLCKIHEAEGLFGEAKRLASVLLDYFPDAKRVARLHDKYSVLAEDRRDPEPVNVTPHPPTPVEWDQEVELELAPEPSADKEDESTMKVVEASGVIETPAIAQPDESMEEPVDAPSEAMDEEKTVTRPKRRRGQALSAASPERQLTLVKLEGILSSISRLRK